MRSMEMPVTTLLSGSKARIRSLVMPVMTTLLVATTLLAATMVMTLFMVVTIPM